MALVFSPASLLSLVSVLVLGAATGWEDFKKGIIRNEYVLAGLLVGLFVQGLDSYGSQRLYTAVLSIVFALIVGFFIWYSGFWTAGDAKLYAAFVALLPLSLFGAYASAFSLAYVLLVLTFIPAFIVFALKAVWSSRGGLSRELWRSLAPANLFGLATSLFAISWGLEVVMRQFGFGGNYLTYLLVVFFLYRLLTALLPVVLMVGLPLLVVVLRVVFDYPAISTSAYWAFFAIEFVALLVLNFFFVNLGYKAFSKPVAVSALREGMLPAQGVVEQKRKGRYGLVPLQARYSLTSARLNGIIVPSESWWFSAKDVYWLKAQAKAGRLGFSKVLVQQTLPFAPFLALGALLSLFLGGYLLGLL